MAEAPVLAMETIVQFTEGVDEGCSDGESELDSLFDSASPILDQFSDSPNFGATPGSYCYSDLDIPIAQRTQPSISGLFFDPAVLIPKELAANLAEHTNRYFNSATSCSTGVNQVMFFGRASEKGSGLPLFLDELVSTLSSLLQPHLSTHAHRLLFPSEPTPAYRASRQAILNHYTPGEGITPHVDLLTRFADGIVGVSLGSGTVMTFRRVADEGSPGELGEGDRWDVYLPERSVLVLTGDARYKWTHGIEQRLVDGVMDKGTPSWIERDTRVSITLRWLLPGADIVGEDE